MPFHPHDLDQPPTIVPTSSMRDEEPAEIIPASYSQQERLAILEAMLFASPVPVKVEELTEASGWTAANVRKDLEELENALEPRGFQLERVADAYRLVTKGTQARFVEKLLGVQTRRRLTRAQLETLAIVSYRQPVTRAQAEALRGVSCERLLGQLVDLRLIREVGRAELPGKPIIYGTTPEFLRYFGLNSLHDLPDIGELKRRQNPAQVSASQASWNAAARGESDQPSGFSHTRPEEILQKETASGAKPLVDTPLSAATAAPSVGPSQGLMKLFDRIRGKKAPKKAIAESA